MLANSFADHINSVLFETCLWNQVKRTSYAFHNLTAQTKAALKADSSHIDFSESSNRKVDFMHSGSSTPYCYKYI